MYEISIGTVTEVLQNKKQGYWYFNVDIFNVGADFWNIWQEVGMICGFVREEYCNIREKFYYIREVY